MKKQIIFFLLILGISSCSTEGPPGPTGPQGATGPQGQTGTPGTNGSNGTIGVYTFGITPGNWFYVDNVFPEAYVNLNVQALTQQVLSTGVVMVYGSSTTDTWVQLPFTSLLPAVGGEISSQFILTPNNVEIVNASYIATAAQLEYNAVYKVVIITEPSIIAKKHIDTTSINGIEQYLSANPLNN